MLGSDGYHHQEAVMDALRHSAGHEARSGA